MQFSSLPASDQTFLIKGTARRRANRTPILGWSVGASSSGGVVSVVPIVPGKTINHLSPYTVQLPDGQVVDLRIDDFGYAESKTYLNLDEYRRHRL